ncbi:MAG: hypothetical protein ACE366_17580 [Bradymonadia bacterium]
MRYGFKCGLALAGLMGMASMGMGCGPRQAQVIRRIEPPPPSTQGPPPSAEETRGEVPPLKPIVGPKVLVPAKLTTPADAPDEVPATLPDRGSS